MKVERNPWVWDTFQRHMMAADAGWHELPKVLASVTE